MTHVNPNIASEQTTVVVREVQANVVEVSTPGPQGPPMPPPALGDLTDVNTASKTAGSVLYYDSISGTWKGDDINTVTTLTDGGNF